MSRFHHSSGYVYLVTSPDQPDLCKIGHTRRPPHRRIQELGKTTWLTPMVIRWARFSWDCIAMEKHLHRQLDPHRLPGSEEWFQIPAGQAIALVRDYPEVVLKNSKRKPSLQEDRLDLSEQLDWAIEDIEKSAGSLQSSAWAEVERLSSSGYASASWFLAEHLEKQDIMASPWVYDAAAKQGHPGASLRRDWVLSLTGHDPRRSAWVRAAERFLECYPDTLDWGQEDRETWEKEMVLCQVARFLPSPQWGEKLDQIKRQWNVQCSQ